MPIYTDRKLLIYYPTSAYIRPHGCLCPIVNTVFYGKIAFANYKIGNFGSPETFFTIKTSDFSIEIGLSKWKVYSLIAFTVGLYIRIEYDLFLQNIRVMDNIFTFCKSLTP